MSVKKWLPILYPTPPSREHQQVVGLNEIAKFVEQFNRNAKGGDQLRIVRENIKHVEGRKALNGEDLYFNTTIIQKNKI